MSADLAVLLHGEPVGRVREGRDRACWFSYLPEYTERRDAVPLSLTMPVGGGRYEAHEWLQSLLPNRLDVLEHWAGLHASRSLLPMDMLATPIGWDCAGAVQFCVEDDLDEMLSRDPGLEALSTDELGAHLESVRRGVPNLPDAPPWTPFSLAGAQAKTVLRRIGSQWAIPTGGAPSTHILKVALPGFEDNDLVEHICMRTLRRCGVPAARTEILRAGNERAIAVERYDRIIDNEGLVTRVHQEDLCQALGFPSHLKYQRHGGPSPADVAGLLRDAADGGAALALFRDALICNWLLAAPDAHAKNYSLLLSGSGYSLAPLYDVCSMVPYMQAFQSAEDIVLGMSVGDAWSVGECDDLEAWLDCSDDLAMDAGGTLKRVEELAERIPEALAAVVDELPQDADSPRVGVFAEQIRDRAKRRREQLAQPTARDADPASDLQQHAAEARPALDRPTARDADPAGDGFRLASRPSARPARERKRTRCPHTGRRSGRRCVRPYKHKGPHRYQRPSG